MEVTGIESVEQSRQRKLIEAVEALQKRVEVLEQKTCFRLRDEALAQIEVIRNDVDGWQQHRKVEVLTIIAQVADAAGRYGDKPRG